SCHSDWEDRNAVLEARAHRQLCQRLAQGRLGQFTGHKKEMRRIHQARLSASSNGMWGGTARARLARHNSIKDSPAVILSYHVSRAASPGGATPVNPTGILPVTRGKR